MTDYDVYIEDDEIDGVDYPYLTTKDGDEYFIVAADADGYYCNKA